MIKENMVSIKNNYLKSLISIVCVVTASFVLSFNIKSFVRAANLLPGGFTGLSLLIQRSFDVFFNVNIPYSLINITLNAFPAMIGFRLIGKKFTTYTVLLIILNSLMVDFIPVTPLTYDPLLVAVVGGILNGTALCIALYGHASTGGTDFIAVYLSNKLKKSSWSFVFILNCIILLVAGCLFGFEAAMYSIIFQFVSTQVVEKFNKRDQKLTLLVITSIPDKIEEKFLEYSHHGMTRFDGTGSYLKKNQTMLMTVIAANEFKQSIHMIREIDPQVFIDVIESKDVKGKFYMQPIE